MNPFYTDYSEYLQKYFPGQKIQKISVNASLGCPNRDGTIGSGGCIYCNNSSFTPGYCISGDSISRQIEKGKKFFSRKYADMKFLAYFQSFTNTYLGDKNRLELIYREALREEDVAGLIIGTRPDCIDDETIEVLDTINREKPVFVEIGVESMHDDTLRRINRGHDSNATLVSIGKLVKAGLPVGAHLIAGLPGETENDALDSIKRICETGIESIKLHHLQVLKGTMLARMWEAEEIEIKPWDMDQYLEFCCKVVAAVPRGIAIERFLSSAPPEMVIAPKWGIKNYEFTNLLINKLQNKQKV